MAAASRLRGGGVDPLFTVVFYAAAIVNMITALVPEPTPLETLIVGGLHAAFLARVTRARQVAGSQRARELRAYPGARGRPDASSCRCPAGSSGSGAREIPEPQKSVPRRCAGVSSNRLKAIQSVALFVALVTRSVHPPRTPGATRSR